MKKQYVGISRDHSGSMGSLRSPAASDYNNTVQALRAAANENGVDTVVSVTSCGIESRVKDEVVNSSVSSLKTLTRQDYIVDGSTPLFDSVGRLIELLKRTPDYNNPNVTFLVIAITDGEENASRIWKHTLGAEIKKLQASDRWTFVFRVPRGYRMQLELLGIPSGNIQEWETTERGLRESTSSTTSAISDYYKGVTRGVTSTKTFYTNLSKVSSNDVLSAMKDISNEVVIYPVSTRLSIDRFAMGKQGSLVRGKWFYQLSKPEKAVQDYKIIVVRSKSTGAVNGGGAARKLLSLPSHGTISLRPGDHGDYDIFIQSTSLNRVLLPGTSALYWENAR